MAAARPHRTAAPVSVRSRLVPYILDILQHLECSGWEGRKILKMALRCSIRNAVHSMRFRALLVKSNILHCPPALQIVNDLRTLRELATALLRYDCVTFLTLLDTLRLSEGRNSVWLFHSAAHTIFQEVSSHRKPLHVVAANSKDR